MHAQGTSLVEKLVTDITKLGLASEMLDRLGDEYHVRPFKCSSVRITPTSKLFSAPPPLSVAEYGTKDCDKRDWAAEERRDLLLNAHLTPEMRSAILKVVELLLSGEVAKFEENPNTNTYTAVVGARPELKERLLAFARTRFLPPKDRWMDLKPAFKMFQVAHADEELLSLLEISKTNDTILMMAFSVGLSIIS